MYTFLIIIHILACLILVVTVLLQQGKGAEIGAVFGSSEAIFGSSGPTPFLGKVTAVVAVIFMCTSISLTYMAAHRGSGSLMQGVKSPPPITNPLPKATSGPVKPLGTAKKAGNVSSKSVVGAKASKSVSVGTKNTSSPAVTTNSKKSETSSKATSKTPPASNTPAGGTK